MATEVLMAAATELGQAGMMVVATAADVALEVATAVVMDRARCSREW